MPIHNAFEIAPFNPLLVLALVGVAWIFASAMARA